MHCQLFHSSVVCQVCEVSHQRVAHTFVLCMVAPINHKFHRILLCSILYFIRPNACIVNSEVMARSHLHFRRRTTATPRALVTTVRPMNERQVDNARLASTASALGECSALSKSPHSLACLVSRYACKASGVDGECAHMRQYPYPPNPYGMNRGRHVSGPHGTGTQFTTPCSQLSYSPRPTWSTKDLIRGFRDAIYGMPQRRLSILYDCNGD